MVSNRCIFSTKVIMESFTEFQSKLWTTEISIEIVVHRVVLVVFFFGCLPSQFHYPNFLLGCIHCLPIFVNVPPMYPKNMNNVSTMYHVHWDYIAHRWITFYIATLHIALRYRMKQRSLAIVPAKCKHSCYSWEPVFFRLC